MFRKISTHPLQTINYLELAFAFVAHVITIPILGVLTGLMCGCAVLYTIRIQQDGSKPQTRRRAFYGTLFFKIGQTWIHQTSFLFVFTWSGKTLPFGLAADIWAWIITVFIFALDVWALSVTSQEAAEKAEATEIEASFARAAEREEKDRLARLERERLAMEERLALAKVEAETRQKLAEEKRKAAEVAAEVERKRVEMEWKMAEDARKIEEERWKAAEDARKLAEQERKEAERLRKEEERARKVAEDEERRREEEKKEKQREIWRMQKQSKKINHNQPVETTETN